MRLIDGDSLKRKAQKVATESWKMKIKANVETVLNQFIDWIDAAPTIEPQRKTGTWQRKYSRPGVYADLRWHCSICGGKFSDTYANMWKYCPDCGSYNGGNNDNS